MPILLGENLERELLEAKRNRKSEQLTKRQVPLFEAAWQARKTEAESVLGEDDDDFDSDAGSSAPSNERSHKRGGRHFLARHLKRERMFTIWPRPTMLVEGFR